MSHVLQHWSALPFLELGPGCRKWVIFSCISNCRSESQVLISACSDSSPSAHPNPLEESLFLKVQGHRSDESVDHMGTSPLG